MERDRTTALCNFLRFLSGNPDGNATARSMVLGALAPIGVVCGQIYAYNGTSDLDLIGNFGFPDDEAANYRTLPISMPLPICDAFTSLVAVVRTPQQLAAQYALLASEPELLREAQGDPDLAGSIICVPVMYSGVPVGALSLLQSPVMEWMPADWTYLDGATSAIGMWMTNQRSILIDRWRRAAPTPHREVRITERQRQILEKVAVDRTNGEIARDLGYSVPTIKKDLQQIMRILGTQDRRATAGRAREIGLLPERRARDL